jgi:hypothetical protein
LRSTRSSSWVQRRSSSSASIRVTRPPSSP